MTKSKKSNFSKHIYWKEATGSNTAKKLDIDNTPTEEALANMKILADELFEPLREKIALGGQAFLKENNSEKILEDELFTIFK